ncbi:MAG: LytR/AlgR family response regulator transcription factor [Eubacteriaceae bacterium]
MVTILIVEDELVIQEYLEKIISTLDYEINILKSQFAEEALAICKANRVDIFLLDIQLLDYSGLQLAEKIRNLNCYILTPIIFLTALPSKELMAFKKYHCYDYILKPFSEEIVKNTLQTIIEHGINISIPTITFKKKELTYVYKQDEIISIEVKNRNLLITTVNDSNTFTQYTLNYVIDELENNFVRCHKGFIINLNFIERIDRSKNLLYMRGIADPIPYGRKYRKLFKEI